jgi:hypothetical protein
MQPGIPMLGEPAVVTAGADELATMGATLLRLAATLEAIADDDITEGESIDAIRNRTESAATKARTVEPRYTETAAALHEYAIALGVAQRDLASAEAAYRTAGDDVARMAQHEWELQREIDVLDRADPARADLERDLVILQSNLEDERAALNGSSAAITAAWQAFQEAGSRAANRIHPALDAMNDGLFDHVGSFFGDIVGFLSVVGEWIVRILDTLLTSLLLIVLVVVAAVVILAIVLVFFPIIVSLLLSGVLTFDLLLEQLVGIALVLVPILAPIVKTILVREALTPTPVVRPAEPYGGELVDRGGRSEYEYLFHNNGVLDNDGARESTVVEVVQVFNGDGTPRLDENGNPMWRVTLPSTMDWQLVKDGAFGDGGAVNDLGSNLALIMDPGMQAAYERAVLQAMRDAGIGPNDPVMLAGWSQGGILAGAIASDPGSGFNVTAITVAGSPIDHMPIPDSVAVLAFQHDGDAVPRLDGTPPQQGPNWVTVNEGSGGAEYPHNIGDYASTAADPTQYADEYPAMDGVLDAQERFFSDYEVASRYEFSEQETAIL